jgi:hypothetical protein
VLYRPEAFEPLTDAAWVPARVRDAIREIAADAEAACRPKLLWPAHEWDAWQSPRPLKTLYSGAAGVVWGLARLRERGYADPRLDLARVAGRALEAWREKPGVLAVLPLPEPAHASLLMGETGILTVLWRLEPSDELADALYARVRENVSNSANDVMWGSPGTMLAAHTMFDWTGEERWAEAWRESATALLSRRDADGFWPNELHGEVSRGLGPPHGLVGDVLALLQEPGHEHLAEEAAALLHRTAVVEDGLANWPTAEGEPLLGRDGQFRVQWDYGAPGIVASAALYLDEELLVAGAELAWKAGPPGPEKGPCICHGTAGNGYSFLKTFERTQDERWLERARRFAVHALEQVQRKPPRYSLWTGDIGVALYAADCLEARSGYPVLETWD